MLAKNQAELTLQAVAEALGPEMLTAVAFVGDCTTALHVSDELALQSIRFTVDIDFIFQIIGRTQLIRAGTI